MSRTGAEETSGAMRPWHQAWGRERIAFAAGLLAILLALSPAYPALDRARFLIFGDEFRLSYGYLTFGAMLGLAVYLYGFSLLFGPKADPLRQVGDWLYFVALLCPPTFLLIYVIGGIQNFFLPDPDSAETFGNGLLVGMSLLMPVVAYLLQRALATREAERASMHALDRSRLLLSRAVRLFDSGFFEHAVIEATNAIISAAERRMPGASIDPRPARIADVYAWLSDRSGLNLPNLRETLGRIREVRNEAAHGRARVTKEECKRIIEEASRIADALAAADETA